MKSACGCRRCVNALPMWSSSPENRVKRAVVMTDGPLLSAVDLGLAVSEEKPQSLGIREARARAEREVLQRALAQAGSNLSKAARLLGISRPTLYDLMQQHQIGLDLW